MLKKIYPVLLFTTLLLAACQAAPSVPSQSSTPTTSAPPMQGCRVMGLLPAVNPTVTALIPAVSAQDHILGSPDAPVTLLEYSDFQCPYCAQIAPILQDLVKKFPNQVRLVYRFFPLSNHSNALVAAYAAEAAGRQNKFFEFGEYLFANQEKWAGLSNAEASSWFLDQAAAFQLDKDKMASDMNAPAVQEVVNQSLKVASDAQIPGTPFLFINGQPYQANTDIDTLSSMVRLYLLDSRTYKSCPPMTIDPKKQYTATFKTEKGDIVAKLYPDKAPLAVNNFVFLARAGWYNETTFHRVIKNFIVQGGDPSGSGYGGPGYQFDNEYKEGVFTRGGLLAMANNGPNTNGSQFFITFNPAPNLNGNYTIFGEVIEGQDVMAKITLRDPSAAATSYPPGDQLLSVTIQEK